ncbi:DUF4340 domain-containing protein [bacterium]|jgi:hypothetical protein|nr:DUF4340 domain-containing protein [bacterium]MBT7311834.1 DUF4340 domain-containing protein [bacterium]
MNKKTIIILLVVLALLVIASLTQKESHRNAVTQKDNAALFATEFDAANISRIVITQGADSTGVVLDKLEQWVSRSRFGYTADENKIYQLLNMLNGLDGQFRSDKEQVLVDYGLGGSEAVTVSLFDSDFNEVVSLEIGKSPAGGTGHFIRSTTDNKVYLTNIDVLAKMGLVNGPELPNHAFFLDTRIFSTTREDVRAFTLYQGNEIIALEKRYAEVDSTIDFSTWDWEITKPEKTMASNAAVDQLLNSLISINAADMADPAIDMEKVGLWKAAKRLEVKLADGSTFELRVGDKWDGDPSGYYVDNGNPNTRWIIIDIKIDQIFKSLEDLLPE